MKTNVKRVSIFTLALSFIVSVLLAIFALFPASAGTATSVTASAATNANITGVAWNSSGYIYLYTDVPTSSAPTNINANAYLAKWRYQNITMNGISAVSGGLWDNGGYFSDNGNGYYRYTLPFTLSDVETVEPAADGYKYLNFKMAKGANIGAEYVVGSDFEYTIVFNSSNTFSGVYKTARITHVVNHSTDNSYFWYQFYTNVLGSESLTNRDHGNYMTPWRTTQMLVNGSAVVSGGDFYYGGGFRNDASRAFRNTDGTQANLYQVWMTGISKSSVNKLSDKKIKIELLPGRRLGDEYIFGYQEDIIIDYSDGTSKHSLPITGTSIVSHGVNAPNGTYEVFVNLPGVTDFKNNALIAPIRAAIKVDGKELSTDEKNMTYFTGGNFKIVGKTDSTGAFAAGKIHEVVIPVDTKFEAEYYVNTSNGAGYVEGYTNRTLQEEIRFYVYQNSKGEFQVVKNEADIEVEAVPEDPYLGALSSVESITYTEGKGWKVVPTATSTDSNCFRFILKKNKTAEAVAAGNDTLTITFGGAFDGAAIAGNPVNCNVWFLLPNAGNGNLAWKHGSYISQLTGNGDGTYSYKIDLTDATYDFVNYDIVIRVSYNDVHGNEVKAAYIHSIEYTAAYSFDVSDITMVKGASVRMSWPTGLGFTTRIDKAAYDAAVAACGEENVTVGTLILPTDYLTCDFTIAALNANGIMYKNVVNNGGWKNASTVAKDGYYEYRGSLAPVQEYNYNRNFSARGYLAYTADGVTEYVYTDYNAENNSRNVTDVAQKAYEDVYTAGPDKNAWWTSTEATVAYTEGKGWKISSTSTTTDKTNVNYNFYFDNEVIGYYVGQGATTMTITVGGSFDGTSYSGNPVNCQAWIIPTKADNTQDWTYKNGYMSSWTNMGNNQYAYTLDLTNANYNFLGADLRMYVTYCEKGSGNNYPIGSVYVYNVAFNVPEKNAADYPHALEKDEFTFMTEGMFSPYTTAERNTLTKYIPFDSALTESYKIVKSASATASETTAADMLAGYLSEAMGINCEVITDAAVSNFSGYSKYISIGQTTLLEAAGLGNAAETEADYDGYVIKTKGGALFIDGVNDRGTIYGVMDFAEKYFGYVFIDGDCYTAGSAADLDVKDIQDEAFTPYIETRSYLEYDVCQGYTDPVTAVSRKSNNYYVKNVSSYGGANNFGYWGDNPAHTMEATLKKGMDLAGDTNAITTYAYKYTTGSIGNRVTHYQPCYTNATTKALMANAMKELIKANYASGIRYYALTQEDSSESKGWCTCSNCNSARTTYGGASGLTLKFVNDIVNILDSDEAFAAQYPDYKIYTFAYNYSFAVPTVSNTVIKACDKVAVMLCPSANNYMKDLFDSQNSESKNALEGWHNYCEDLMVWMYDANFTDYVEYHPTLNGVIAHNVYKMKQHGVSYVMINGAYNGDGLWDDKLRAYVYSELLYNFDEAKYFAGADAYVNEIVEEYVTAYFGGYANTVMGIINDLQTAFNEYGTLSANKSSANNIDVGIIQDAISAIEAAISANTDETLETRLYQVKASLLATLFENNGGKNMSTTNKAEFKTACANGGITQWSETQTITDKFGS